MPRGVGGSGQEVSQITAVPKLFVTATGETTATVKWASAPTVAGKPTRTGYTYVVKNLTNNTTASPVTVTSAGLTSVTLSLTGLTASRKYELSVVLNYSGSQKSTATTVIFNTDDVPPSVNPVTNLTHTLDYHTKTTLTWTNPAGDFDGIVFTISGYDGVNPVPLYTFTVDKTDGATSLLLENLTPNSEVSVSARAYRDNLQSPIEYLTLFALPPVEALALTFPVVNAQSILVVMTPTVLLQGSDTYNLGISPNIYTPNPNPLPNQETYTTLPQYSATLYGLNPNTLYYIYANKRVVYTDRVTGLSTTFTGLDSRESVTTIAPLQL